MLSYIDVYDGANLFLSGLNPCSNGICSLTDDDIENDTEEEES